MVIAALRSNDDVLLEIAVRYLADRDTNQPGYASGFVPPACPWCGKHRTLLPGSTLEGHARCIVSDAFKTWFCETLRSSTLSMRAVAAELKISQSAVRAWWSWWQERT